MRRKKFAFITAGLIFIVCVQSASGYLRPYISAMFSFPPAFLTHLYTGGNIIETGNCGYIVQTASISIKITEACSGFSFFLTLTTVVFVTGVLRNVSILKLVLPVVLPAYLLTLILNTSRIISSYYIKTLLPLNPRIPYETIHLALGVCIFFPALVGAYCIAVKYFGKNNKCYAHKKEGWNHEV